MSASDRQAASSPPQRDPSAATTEPPIFVDGIGPPLSQIEQDYREILTEAEAGYVYGLPHLTCARDVLALIAEIRRLRAA